MAAKGGRLGTQTIPKGLINMKTLDEIVDAVRRGDEVEHDELRLAVVAFDVLLANLDLPQDHARLSKYMLAAGLPPRRYVGKANDPDQPEAVEWYVRMKAVSAPQSHEWEGDHCAKCGDSDWYAGPTCKGRAL